MKSILIPPLVPQGEARDGIVVCFDGRGITNRRPPSSIFGFALATVADPPPLSPSSKSKSIHVGGCLGGPPTCTDCKYNRFDCVIDYSKGCQSVNYDCPACELWRGIAECRLRTPVPSYCSDTYFYAPSDPAVKNWLIEPTAPNYIGLEDLLSSSANPAIDTLWRQAWGDATAGVDGRKKIADADLALVINSVQARTKHSLHIHAGTATAPLKTCVNALPKAAAEDTWLKGPVACKGLRSTATELTDVYYTLVTAAKRDRVNAFLLDGLKFSKLFVEKDVDVGFALVGAPKSAGAGPDDNYLLIYNGKGVNDKKLLVQ